MGETSIVHICLHFEPGRTALGEDLDRLNDRIIDLIDREFPHHSGMAMLVELGGRMSPLYFGGTDCPICGATIPQGEPCQICALRAQLTERDREIERLKAGWDASEARFDADVEAARADLDREIAELRASLQAMQETAAEQSRIHVEMHNRIVELGGKLAQQIKAYSRLAAKHITVNGRLVEERDAAIQRAEKAEAHPVMVEHLHYMKLGDIVRLEEDLAASQAREREAVEELKLCQRILEQAGCHQVGIHNGIYGLIAKVRSSESALAAARKALEKIAQAPGDNIGVWCRHTATAALERINGEGHE